DNNIKYLGLSDKVMGLIREKVEADEKEQNIKISDSFKEAKSIAIREYFMKSIISDAKRGREYDADMWKSRIDKVYNDKTIWDNIAFKRNSIRDTEYEKFLNKKIENNAGEELISGAIKNNVLMFKGRINKYEKLDDDQKKIFAIALVLMEKGAIGYGTEGTGALLIPHENQTKNTDKIKEELDKYVRGEEFHFEVDYKEAFNKLVNYGESSLFYIDRYTLSRTAYDKALQFTHAITAKKLAFGPKDLNRLNDGYASINAAYNKYGKNQLQELDKLKGEEFTLKDVKNKLLEYTDKDISFETEESVKKAAKSVYKFNGNLVSIADKAVTVQMKMRGLRDRLRNINEADLKLFVRIMQERAVLDRSSIPENNGLHTDQKKRNALLEALAADVETRTAVLNGFDDTDSCYQVLVNSLSFQLRDDINFTGQDLTKDHFAAGALNRKYRLDWGLLERAFEFMDEIKERRAMIYALSHASDYIELSDNEEAKKENQKLEKQFRKKEDFKREHFEEYIRGQANKVADDEIQRVVSGYNSLTDKEKNLFFKVLGRRDMLDISKKDYKKSFFGIADRNYVNQAERDKLIDQYISSNMEDNVGITLEADAHYNALKSLFSTQLSDREKFTTDREMAGRFAVERNLFMGRATAIDWKLFKRALNFVLRASEELEYTEGNAQLYRGTGNLLDDGRLAMDYKFLRKNFHRTGNQWGRFAGRLFGRTVHKEIITKDVLEGIVGFVGTVDSAADFLGFSSEGGLRKGIGWLKKNTTDFQSSVEKFQKNQSIDQQVSLIELKNNEYTGKNKEKAEKKERERREKLSYYKHIEEGINNVIANAKTLNEATEQIVGFLKDDAAPALAEMAPKIKWIDKTDEIKANVNEQNPVEEINKNSVADDSYGDFRDTLKNGNESLKDVKEAYDKTKRFVNVVHKSGKKFGPTKGITNLIAFSTEKAVNKFVVESLMKERLSLKRKSDETDAQFLEREAKIYREEVDKHVSVIFKQLLNQTVGEENAERLLAAENYYYSIKKGVTDNLLTVLKGSLYARKCVSNVKNIVTSIDNLKLLNISEDKSKDKREVDDENLRKAKEKGKYDEAQAEKVKNIVNKHRGLGSLSKDIGQAIQKFNIADSAINLAIETCSICGGKLSADAGVIRYAIKSGLEFAMFAMRVASDRDSLAAYYKNTDAGKTVVDKVKTGIKRAGDDVLMEELDNALSKDKTKAFGNLVDIISDARGYEHTSELMENTAMSMAQSIVFCASNYNPMLETKLMAITVMSVMGLNDDIGNTSPKIVEKLFNSFKMNR
nr:hypothetical protein [Lachnospiraceae bacterium]